MQMLGEKAEPYAWIIYKSKIYLIRYMVDQERTKNFLLGYYVSITRLWVVVPKPDFA